MAVNRAVSVGFSRGLLNGRAFGFKNGDKFAQRCHTKVIRCNKMYETRRTQYQDNVDFSALNLGDLLHGSLDFCYHRPTILYEKIPSFKARDIIVGGAGQLWPRLG